MIKATGYSYTVRGLVSVRKVIESCEGYVIQESYRSLKDKTDVDFRKSWLL